MVQNLRPPVFAPNAPTIAYSAPELVIRTIWAIYFQSEDKKQKSPAVCRQPCKWRLPPIKERKVKNTPYRGRTKAGKQGQFYNDATKINCGLIVRGHKVLIDSDLAELYGVTTKVLNQGVKRNLSRFPDDFMFQLTWEEANALLRSQTVTLKQGQNVKYRPKVFTEQGVAMLSSVLRSERAVQVNIAIMRAFVRLREMLSTHKELASKLEELERKYDSQFRVVFDAIRQLMVQPAADTPKPRIGFHATRTSNTKAKGK